MKSFFYLHFKEDDWGGVALSQDASISEIAELDDKASAPVQFSLAANVAQDYQANDLGWPLMSNKLKEILGELVDGGDLVWHRALVLTSGGGQLDYFVPRFLRAFDVIDKQKSKIVSGPIGDVIIKACLSASKVASLDFFPLPGSEIRLIVSNRLKSAIELAGLSGVDFSAVPSA